MIAILINIIFVLLYSEIAVIDSQNCDLPNEEFRNNSCETYCQQYQAADCFGENRTSDCFCQNGTVRDLISDEYICGGNQTFNDHFGGEEICSCNGTISRYYLFLPMTACHCNVGFIRDREWSGECKPTSECEERNANSTC